MMSKWVQSPSKRRTTSHNTYGSENLNEDEIIEKIGNVCGKIGTGILMFGIGLAVGIPFLGLLSGDKKYPLE
jgi:hypothetical protein